MKIRISLTSGGYKILCIFLSAVMVALTILLIVFYKQVPWLAVFFVSCVALICIFACFLCFNHRIIIDQNTKSIKIHALKTTTIYFADIQSIKVDVSNSVDQRKYCFILFELKNGDIFRTSEYTTLFKNKAVSITQKKVKLLNEMIQEL